jgi:hypothetical protein
LDTALIIINCAKGIFDDERKAVDQIPKGSKALLGSRRLMAPPLQVAARLDTCQCRDCISVNNRRDDAGLRIVPRGMVARVRPPEASRNFHLSL